MDGTRKQGFTLVELLMVLVILAVLASLAWPAYLLALQQQRRGDAIDALLRLQLAQEQWRLEHAQYASLDELGMGDSAAGHYQLAISGADAAGYHATATPRADGAQAEDVCGVFAVNQGGPDHGDGYADARCWKR